MDRDKAKAKTSIVGKLEGFFETGTEGVCWAVYEDGKTGYEGLHFIKTGQHLKVWDPTNGRSVFDERVVLDTKIGRRLLTDFNPQAMKGVKQQCALEMWVHGIQTGWDPDEWAKLFFRSAGETVFRAELTLVPSREKRVKMEKSRPQPTKFRRKRP